MSLFGRDGIAGPLAALRFARGALAPVAGARAAFVTADTCARYIGLERNPACAGKVIVPGGEFQTTALLGVSL